MVTRNYNHEEDPIQPYRLAMALKSPAEEWANRTPFQSFGLII